MIFNSFGYNTDPVTQVATGSLWVTGVGMVVSLILGIGTINIFLGLSRGEDKHIKELVTTVTFKKFFVYLIASILYGVMMFVGLILLIIPGLIVVSIFLPYVYFIVDKDAGIIDSLKPIGLMHVFIQTAEGKKVERGDLIDGFTFNKFFSFIGAYVLYTVVVLIGLVLFIVPGVYAAVALLPIFYTIVDKGLNPVQALREAYVLTKGSWWNIMGLIVTTGIISLVITFVVLSVFAFLAWIAFTTSVSVLAALVVLIAVPSLILLTLGIQTYIGLVYALMYKELRDGKKGK